MYLRRINVNLYQDIKVLTHYCSTIGKPISGLDIFSTSVTQKALFPVTEVPKKDQFDVFPVRSLHKLPQNMSRRRIPSKSHYCTDNG